MHEEWGEGEAAEVDLVLTAGEIVDLILEEHRLGRLPPPSAASAASAGQGAEEEEEEEEAAAALAAFWALGGGVMAGHEEEGEDSMDVDEGAEQQLQGQPQPQPHGAWTLASAESALLLSGLDPEAPSQLLAGQVPGAEGGGASGGFLEFVFRHAARELFGVEVGWEQPLVYQQGRNADYHEVLLELPQPSPNGNVGNGSGNGLGHGQDEPPSSTTHPVALRFARAYGFRNIQAVMNKMRRNKERAPLHFVEIMACPSGCVNGGGQLKGPPGEASAVSRERVGRVRAALEEGRRPRPPAESAVAQWVYGPGGIAAEGPLGGEALRLFHTRYHAVPKLELSNPSVIKW